MLFLEVSGRSVLYTRVMLTCTHSSQFHVLIVDHEQRATGSTASHSVEVPAPSCVELCFPGSTVHQGTKDIIVPTHSPHGILGNRFCIKANKNAPGLMGVLASLGAWASRAFKAWKRLQVSYYGGKYSLQRVLALESYTRKATSLRVLLVCVGTLLPMIAVVFAQELVPLQDPRAGWHNNSGFWIRATVLLAIGVRTLTVQATYFVDGVKISVKRQALLSLSVAVVMTAFSVTLASQLIFPIPFFLISTGPIVAAVHFVLFRVVLGARTVQQMLRHQNQLTHYMNFVNAQAFMALVYPAYEALFRLSEGSPWQVPVIIFLPLMKLGIKNIVLRCTRHIEDMTPEAVIFTVDLFNGIYISTCMQSATSAATISAITLTDQVQTFIMLYGLHRRTVSVLGGLNASMDTSEENLLTALCALLRDPKQYQKQARTGVRKLSGLPHVMSAKDRSLLDMLDRIPSGNGTEHDASSFSNSPKRKSSKLLEFRRCFFKNHRSRIIHPSPVLRSMHIVQADESRAVEPVASTISNSLVLQEALKTLFTVECQIVAAYLEVVIPFLYGTYILVMVHLPSSRYHSEMTGISSDTVGATLLPVFMLGFLQIVSLAMVVAVIRRNCGIGALHQLAFVLETQMPLIQDKLMFWPVMTMCFRVVHFGVDFTFKFKQV